MIERKHFIAPAIVRQRNLTIEDLKSLNLPLIFTGDTVIIERSLDNWKLKTPLSIDLSKILAVGEKGLVDYIIRSCIREQPSLILYIFEYKSLLKLCRHFLRDDKCSGSYYSCRNYSAAVKKYAEWHRYSPDEIIDDVKSIDLIPDPLRVQNHNDFLNEYKGDLQDAGLSPGAVCNRIKAVKTFYFVNGVKQIELKLSRKVKNKDRAPKPEELVQMLDKADARESFIISAIASGAFREGTLASLKYYHAKEDIESGRIPIHIAVEAAITKGKYHDYDTFLNAEASNYLKLYLDERRHGGRSMPPEIITDNSPLIRNSHITDRVLGVSAKTIRKIIHDRAVGLKIAKKLPNSWMYSVRTHSLRKFFRTQMSACNIDDEIIKYMMGKTIDTYEDVQSLGIEKLRNMYSAAGLVIRSKTQTNRIEQLKEIIRAWGANPEEILTKDALIKGNITETTEQTQNHQLSVLAEGLKQVIRKEVME